MMKKIANFFVFLLVFSLFFQETTLFGIAQADEVEVENILVKFKGNDLYQVVKVGAMDISSLLAEYRQRDDVVDVEPDFIYRSAVVPNDVYYDEQWYLKKIKAQQAWDIASDSSDIVIAVIDSGIELRHPDLSPNIWVNEDEIPGNRIDDDKNGFIDDYNGWDFITNTPDPSPKFEEGFSEDGVSHGTIVAGIAAAVSNNNSGIAGVSWNAKIMPLRVLDDKGEGVANAVIRAVDYAIANKADIINFSLISFEYNQALFEAIKRAHKAGIIMVAAAGNEQGQGDGYNLSDIPMYPACHDGDNGENMVIGVAATDPLDQKANFSSYGFDCVDIAAPGVSFFGTVPYRPTKNIGSQVFNKYFDGYWSGTSMAAPVVAGAVALIEGVNRDIGAAEVKDILLKTADNISRLNPGYLGQLGSGRLNVYSAATEAKRRLQTFDYEILVAPLSGHISNVKISNIKGDKRVNFESYSPNFMGGANVTSGDIDGQGGAEIITGAGNGGGPHIRVFDAKGNIITQFFAYNKNFRGGVNVAVGDLDGNGVDEIITGAGKGGGPHIRVFDKQGNVLSQFFAYDKNFRGGVNVATGDVNGDGVNEIIVGPGSGVSPWVRVFNNNGLLLNEFLAYDKNFLGGVKVASADIDGGAARNRDEIITGPANFGGPHVRIFDFEGNVRGQFFAYNKNFRGGISVSAGDIDGDGVSEVITGAGPGGSPHVRVFEIDGSLIGSFLGFESDFSGGVNVGILKSKK